MSIDFPLLLGGLLWDPNEPRAGGMTQFLARLNLGLRFLKDPSIVSNAYSSGMRLRGLTVKNGFKSEPFTPFPPPSIAGNLPPSTLYKDYPTWVILHNRTLAGPKRSMLALLQGFSLRSLFSFELLLDPGAKLQWHLMTGS